MNPPCEQCMTDEEEEEEDEERKETADRDRVTHTQTRSCKLGNRNADAQTQTQAHHKKGKEEISKKSSTADMKIYRNVIEAKRVKTK